MMSMNAGCEDHLKYVAKNNKDLFLYDEKRFERKMLSFGWTEEEIGRMKKYIMRASKGAIDS